MDACEERADIVIFFYFFGRTIVELNVVALLPLSKAYIIYKSILFTYSYGVVSVVFSYRQKKKKNFLKVETLKYFNVR